MSRTHHVNALQPTHYTAYSDKLFNCTADRSDGRLTRFARRAAAGTANVAIIAGPTFVHRVVSDSVLPFQSCISDFFHDFHDYSLHIHLYSSHNRRGVCTCVGCVGTGKIYEGSLIAYIAGRAYSRYRQALSGFRRGNNTCPGRLRILMVARPMTSSQPTTSAFFPCKSISCLLILLVDCIGAKR